MSYNNYSTSSNTGSISTYPTPGELAIKEQPALQQEVDQLYKFISAFKDNIANIQIQAGRIADFQEMPRNCPDKREPEPEPTTVVEHLADINKQVNELNGELFEIRLHLNRLV